MIQLQNVNKPIELTDDIVYQLTEQYKQATGKKPSLWKKSYITDALLTISSNKCCFCESKQGEESKYLEVEHFHPKSIYPDEVISWRNLLPICKRCNVKKSNHDTKLEPIIHPVENSPREHLYLKNFRLHGSTPLGKKTIKVVYLNDRKRLMDKRYEIGTKLSDALDKLLTYIEKSNISSVVEDKNEAIGTLEILMLEGTKENEYSATAATTILQDPNYIEIKKLFLDCNLWSDNFKELETYVNYCALLPEKN